MKFSTNLVALVVAAICALIDNSFSKKITKENCEVCVGVMEKFEKTLTSRSDQSKIRTEFVKFCEKLKKGSKEERFCYYIGGTKDSATSILNVMTRPVSLTMPPTKTCEKLYEKDSQICDLKYEKKIDLVNANFRKMKVKELKKILSDWDADCRGCAEKSDYIKRIMELMPENDPEAYAARKKKEEL
ncbi:mesencephalic astrocyte-derived neurotrophic factor homolog [Tubulanus polymorphus]|uniref:mesencephalic astrocyte-derived neurotrophic factor homolog n=1 Tax=Tubulanus polymorphus TaxID=672921 RepID=UPI003DA27CB3